MRCAYTLALCADCLGQLGVMKALWARELMPRGYAASGIGAVFAGLAACGLEPRDIEALLFALRRNAGALLDIDWRGLRDADALLRGRRFEGLLNELMPGTKLGAFGDALTLIAARDGDGTPVILRGDNVPLAVALRACISGRGILRQREVNGALLGQCDGYAAEAVIARMSRKALFVSRCDRHKPCPEPRISLCDGTDWLEAPSSAWRDAISAGETAAASMADELICLLGRG